MVVDASALVDALLDSGPQGDRARAAIGDDASIAPDFVDLEVIAAIRRLLITGEIGRRDAELAIEDLKTAPIHRTSTEPLIDLIWTLRDNVTPYDASYVAIATTFGVPLVTSDERLAAAPGLPCEVILVAPEQS